MCDQPKQQSPSAATHDDRVSAVITARELHLSYGKTVALAGASVDVREGEILVLTGKSGSGKSSLLYCLAGVLKPDRGQLEYEGASVIDMSDDEVSALRRSEFGFVFQFGELVPELTIQENVGLPLRLNGTRRGTGARVDELLHVLGIEELKRKRPAEVSGGQAQRAAIARALIHRPRVVFADEPTGALDTENSQVVLRQFLDLARTHKVAIVLVTHEPAVAELADRHLELRDGRVLEQSGQS
jgi:putative ABC transport system ATP-binding protein